MSIKEKKSYSPESLEDVAELRTLVLYNDDFNTFDFVIETLVEVCEHDQLQAENCAWIVHYKGKCPVKRGPLEDLKPRYQEMTNRTLTVEIK
jgi:ATP-dependent Clp protease adaptor protein ClpS